MITIYLTRNVMVKKQTLSERTFCIISITVLIYVNLGEMLYGDNLIFEFKKKLQKEKLTIIQYSGWSWVFLS